MKVLLVNGSPHKEGCTYTALREVADALNGCGVDTDMFWIGTKPIAGCIACKNCVGTGKCVFDDRVNEFLEIAGDYDGFVFGSPVHWGSAGGAIVSFLDRAFYADRNGGGKRFRHKPVAAVVSARRAGTSASWDELNRYFGLMQTPIITSRYWNAVHGSTPAEVEKDEEGMQTMRILGRNIAYALKCIAAAKKAGIEPPEEEETVYTNFIRE